MARDLGTRSIHAVEYVSEVIVQYSRGVPVKTYTTCHIINDDTGEELSRDAVPTIREGADLDADSALKDAAAALPAIGERLKAEDVAEAAASLAIPTLGRDA